MTRGGRPSSLPRLAVSLLGARAVSLPPFFALIVGAFVFLATRLAQAQRSTGGPPGGGGALGPASLAMIGMIATAVFIPLSLWRRWLLPGLLAAKSTSAHALAGAGKWIRHRGTPIHMSLGATTAVLGVWHGFVAQRSNVALWSGLVALVALMLVGTLLYSKWFPSLSRLRVPMLVAKWTLTVLTVALLLWGHATVGPRLD